MSNEGPGVEKLQKILESVGMGSVLGMQNPDDITRDHYRITEILKKFDMKRPCAFNVGDFVTPKQESHYRRPGEPCLVVQSFETCQHQFVAGGKPLYSYNMIIARPCLDGDIENINLYLVESEYFEAYTGLVYGDAGEEGEYGNSKKN